MNMSSPIEWSRPQTEDTSSVVDPQLSPTTSIISPTLLELSASEAGYAGSLGQRDDVPSTKVETVGSNKLKKKLSELDIRGTMADFDIRKGGKRHGIEDFYIELDEPHRMFYCPGDVIKGTYHALRRC